MAEIDPAATYTNYHVERGRHETTGWEAMPVAGPTPQAPQLVCLHAAIEYEWVSWVASRYGQHPQMPDPYALSNQTSGLIYLGGKVTDVIPVNTGMGGVHLFCAAGVYWYVRNNAIGLKQPLPLGKLPWEAVASNNFDVDPSYFATTLSSGSAGYQQSNQLPPQVTNPYQGMLAGQ